MNKLLLSTGVRATSLLLGGMMAGCIGDAGSGSDATGHAVAAIAVVPGTVNCVRMSYRGTATNFVVTPGGASTLDLGALPPGTLLLSATAYNAACTSVTGSTAADWVSDPVSAVVSAGLTTNLSITLRPNSATHVSVDFAQPAIQIAAGDENFYALLADGTVRAWGQPGGAIGAGFVPNVGLPLQVQGLTGVRQIAARGTSACAVLANGQAWCWGSNPFGQLGDGTTNYPIFPVQVALPSGVSVTQISIGAASTCALASDGTVWCWGDNSYGQLANNTPTSSLTPVQVLRSGFAPLTGIVEVHVGSYYACARNEQLALVCWGTNSVGGFGTGLVEMYPVGPSTTPFRVVRGFAVSQLGTFAIGFDGSLRGAGYNSSGTLGDGTNSNRPNVTLVGLSNVTQFSAGYFHTCAVVGDGTAWCWGHGGLGELGDVTEDDHYAPVQVHGIANALEVAVAGFTSCARLSDGTVWCWGSNQYGDLGNGTHTNSFVPVRVGL